MDCFFDKFPEKTVDRQKMIDKGVDTLEYLGERIYLQITVLLNHYERTEESYLDVDFEAEKRKEEEEKAERDAKDEKLFQEVIKGYSPEVKAKFIVTMAEHEEIDKEFDLYYEKMGKWIKKCVVEAFAGVEELPGRGFRELDYLLWVYPHLVHQDLLKFEKQLEQ